MTDHCYCLVFAESLQSAAWFTVVLSAIMLALVTTALKCCCDEHGSNDRSCVKQKAMKRGNRMNVEQDQ